MITYILGLDILQLQAPIGWLRNIGLEKSEESGIRVKLSPLQNRHFSLKI